MGLFELMGLSCIREVPLTLSDERLGSSDSVIFVNDDLLAS